MAFFDDLGKKISQAGQTAVQKTKEMTDIARVNGLISDEEKKINNNYYQIGKLYATIHQSDCEEAFAGMIIAIVESESKIKEYRMQIQDIKGVIRCAKCGAEVPKGVAFCSSCGTAVPKAEMPDLGKYTKCDNCGAMIEKGMRFCTSCGKQMATFMVEAPVQAEIPAPMVETPVQVEVPAQIVVETPAKRFCTNCGAQLENDVAFCTECGTKI